MDDKEFRERLVSALERIADALKGEPSIQPRSGGTGRPKDPGGP